MCGFLNVNSQNTTPEPCDDSSDPQNATPEPCDDSADPKNATPEPCDDSSDPQNATPEPCDDSSDPQNTNQESCDDSSAMQNTNPEPCDEDSDDDVPLSTLQADLNQKPIAVKPKKMCLRKRKVTQNRNSSDEHEDYDNFVSNLFRQ